MGPDSLVRVALDDWKACFRPRYKFVLCGWVERIKGVRVEGIRVEGVRVEGVRGLERWGYSDSWVGDRVWAGEVRLPDLVIYRSVCGGTIARARSDRRSGDGRGSCSSYRDWGIRDGHSRGGGESSSWGDRGGGRNSGLSDGRGDKVGGGKGQGGRALGLEGIGATLIVRGRGGVHFYALRGAGIWVFCLALSLAFLAFSPWQVRE